MGLHDSRSESLQCNDAPRRELDWFGDPYCKMCGVDITLDEAIEQCCQSCSDEIGLEHHWTNEIEFRYND